MQHYTKLRFAILMLLSLSFALLFQACKEDKLEVYATGILDGTVMDFTSDINLSGAILTTNPPTVSVVSDSSGYFIFKTIDVGEYNLIARKNGYVSESVAISVQRDKSTTVVVLMERSSEYNDPPEFNGSFLPGNGQTDQLVDLTLSWSVSDPNGEDSLTYDVELYESNHENPQHFAGLTDTTVTVENLSFNTVYYWQVTASDPYISVRSELQSFRTIPLPDNKFRFIRMSDEGDYEIFSSDSSGNTLVRLTRNLKDDWQPRLSPLRDKVAYVAHYNLEPHIFIMNRDGTDQRKITRNPITGYQNPGKGFAWSPSGDQIIYGSYNRLYFIKSDGTLEGILALAPANRHFRDMDYSPDGNLIVSLTVGVNANDSEIYLMNSNGTNPVVLVNNLDGIIECPSFSIDGQKVMYTRDISGYSSGTSRQLDAHIFTIDVNSHAIEDISIDKPDGTNDTNPRFSPDGASVIFESASNVVGSQKSIWTMDIDGGNRRLLFSNAQMPDWR
jgi:TolB protein